ncbi:MAG: SDR family oxidoreductase [Proteobacteria bacterium]|nr:SDR family oxidoreductase [Pseudomonadota bacterium]
MDYGLAGKSAIVTGASRGLGAAIAEALAREGMRLFLIARDRGKLDQVAADLSGRFKVKVDVHAADLTAADAVESAAKAALTTLGAVDVLVNCAGAAKRGDFFKLTEDDWASGFGLKFFGTVRLSRAIWPALAKSRGSIVNIAGLGSRMPAADFTIGGSINSALLNFTKALSEVGVRDGVRVNAINPGYFMTDRITQSLRSESERTGKPADEAAQALLTRLGVTRFGRPEEVGNLVAFMVSEQASYLNGAAIELDSGVRRDI